MFAEFGFAPVVGLIPRRRIVTGSLKLTSEAFFRNQRRLTTFALWRTALRSWRVICAFFFALTFAEAGPAMRPPASAATTTSARKCETLRLRDKRVLLLLEQLTFPAQRMPQGQLSLHAETPQHPATLSAACFTRYQPGAGSFSSFRVIGETLPRKCFPKR